jgi:hypothetical protein
VLVSQHCQRGISVRIGVDGGSVENGAGAGINQRCGVGVFVGVDADDDLGDVCQHGHAFFSLPGGTLAGPGPVRRRQDCDGTRQP